MEFCTFFILVVGGWKFPGSMEHSKTCRFFDAPNTPCLRAKSTVHRLHLKLSKEGVYDKIFVILLSEGYETGKIDLSRSFVDTKDGPAKKGV